MDNPWFVHLAILVFYFLAFCYFTFPFVGRMSDHLPGDLGDPCKFVWVLNWNLEAFLSAPLEIYQANNYYPYPRALAYEDSLFAPALMVLPLRMVTGNPVLLYNIQFLTTFILSGYFVSLLARSLGGNIPASVLAGLFFAYCPYRWFHVGHLNLLNCQWIPLLLWSVHRYFRTWQGRFLVLGGLSYLLLITSSGYYGIYTVPAVSIVIGGEALLHRGQLRWKHFGQAGVVLILVFLISVVIMYPYLANSRKGNTVREMKEIRYYSAGAESYARVCNTNTGLLKMGIKEERVGEKALFPGVLVLLGAVIYLFSVIRGAPASGRRLPWVYGAFILVVIVLSFGPFYRHGDRDLFRLPYYGFYHLFPGAGSLRVVSRLGIYATLGLTLFAAWGWTFLCTRLKRNGRIVMMALMLVFFGFEGSVFPFPHRKIATENDLPPVYRWLRQQPPGTPLLEYPLYQEPYENAIYSYYSCFHRQPIVNGCGSFAPPGWEQIADTLRGFPDPASIAWLSENRIEYVFVHIKRLQEEQIRLIRQNLETHSNSLKIAKESSDIMIVQIIGSAELSLDVRR